MKKDEPAFPGVEMEQLESGRQIMVGSYPGMSKRFYAAVHAMQGMISNQSWMGGLDSVAREEELSREDLLSQCAFGFADALLAEEGRE